MDKIRALVEQLGSKELTDQIIESLESYTEQTKEKFEQKYKQRLARAREVCVEEVESYKKELGRKVQLFLESRHDEIEQQIANQSAINESSADDRLTKIAAIVEGVEVQANDQGEMKETLAEQKEAVAALRRDCNALKKQRETLAEQAKEAKGIAEAALERNKSLEKQLSAARKKLKNAETVLESRKPKKEKEESKSSDSDEAKTLEEGKRKPASPKTTRATRKGSITKNSGGTSDVDGPAKIAAEMMED